jgi:hypothetical protein
LKKTKRRREQKSEESIEALCTSSPFAVFQSRGQERQLIFGEVLNGNGTRAIVPQLGFPFEIALILLCAFEMSK